MSPGSVAGGGAIELVAEKGQITIGNNLEISLFQANVKTSQKSRFVPMVERRRF